MSVMSRQQIDLAETTAKAAQLAQHIVEDGGLPLTTALSVLAKHGGLYVMLNTEMLTARIAPIAATLAANGKMPGRIDVGVHFSAA